MWLEALTQNSGSCCSAQDSCFLRPPAWLEHARETCCSARHAARLSCLAEGRETSGIVPRARKRVSAAPCPVPRQRKPRAALALAQGDARGCSSPARAAFAPAEGHRSLQVLLWGKRAFKRHSTYALQKSHAPHISHARNPGQSSQLQAPLPGPPPSLISGLVAFGSSP